MKTAFMHMGARRGENVGGGEVTLPTRAVETRPCLGTPGHKGSAFLPTALCSYVGGTGARGHEGLQRNQKW